MGEWSPEATGALRASKPLRAGDTFVGLNKFALVRWWTNCTVLHADRGERFEFDVDFGPLPVSRWSYEFSPQPDGSTEVTETWIDRRQRADRPARAAGGPGRDPRGPGGAQPRHHAGHPEAAEGACRGIRPGLSVSAR